MKAAAGIGAEHDSEQAGSQPKEWSGRNVARIALAAALLVAVYVLASWMPAEDSAVSVHTAGRFLMFWIIGGVLTVGLLALSDSRS